MISRVRQWFRNPAFLLAVAAVLLAAVVQSGELGSSDTMHRLQTAHSFWTKEPAVFPDEYPEFGIHGRGGRLYDWYGIGQPLLLLPFDVAGAYIERLPLLAAYRENDPTVRIIVVSFCAHILISVLTALVCFRLLRQFEFTVNQSVAGVLALLLCTTHLHYTQNLMENNYILLMTVAGFAFQYEWLRTGSQRALLAGSAAFGLNLLTRLTTGMDLLAGALFLALVWHWEGKKWPELWGRLAAYARMALPVYAFFLLIDRAYQYWRFGTLFSTYVKVQGEEYHRLYPWLPASYPFNTPFREGFLGALFAPEKSIFLFDPLLVLSLILAIVLWKKFRPEVKAYVATAFVLLLGYVCFYARYMDWSGDFAWGDRYVSTTVQLAAFVGVPLLLRHRGEIGQALWRFGVALIGVGLIVQLASLAFWLPLEIYQMETRGHPTFVIGLRLENIAAFALGRMEAWGLNNQSMTEDAWDYVHITTWNFLPFVLRRVGEIPGWVVSAAFAIWGACLAMLGGILWRMRRLLAAAQPQ